MPADRADIAHLFRRAGFGASSSEIEAAVSAGFGPSVDTLVAGLSGPDRTGTRAPRLSSFAAISSGKAKNTWNEFPDLVAWWVERMATTSTPLREKLVLMLHSQFPTGFEKVGIPILMYNQNEIFRKLGPGSFDALTQAVARDPSMLIWLDTGSDLKQAPNENFARELMERFTMGIGNYSQEDVAQSARAFTGWSMSYMTGRFRLNAWEHDYGEKVFLGHRGDLTGEDIVNIVTHTRASTLWITSRIWSWLAYPVGPNNPIVAELAAEYASDLNVTNLLRAILNHPAFLSPQAKQGLVKQPIEWVAGILRTFHLRATSFKKWGGSSYLLDVFNDLGQTPFNPPTVGGWGYNQFWLSTASSLAQLNFAQTVAEVANLSALEHVSPSARLDVLAELLSIDSWSNQSHAALTHVAKTVPELLALSLTTPEYVVN